MFNDTASWNNVKTYNNTYADMNNTLNGGGEITNTFTCSVAVQTSTTFFTSPCH